MATSGSVTFSMTAKEVIESAFSKIGVKVAEQELEAFEFEDGKRYLNITLKVMASLGLHLWTKTEGVLFLDKSKAKYLLGPNGDKACGLNDFYSTTTASAYTAGATSIDVVSTANFVAADNIGIKLSNGDRFWTTIQSITDGDTLVINNGLPSNVDSGASVFVFTNLIQRPLRILSYRRKTFNQDNEIQVLSWSRDEYFNQVNKLSQGTVVNAYYSPQLNNGELYVWQTVSDVDNYLRFTYERQIEDITQGIDDIDMPVEWMDALIYGLAARLVDDYDTPLAKADRIVAKAASLLEEVQGWDQEQESLNIQPDYW